LGLVSGDPGFEKKVMNKNLVSCLYRYKMMVCI
jgi:hypothetical protein